MITTLPAVQHNCKHARRFISYGPKAKHTDKRIANRKYRRILNRITNTFIYNSELFYNETFDIPSLSSWDIY
jgi:hypothetical protein